ncbi:hypothetical protein ACFCV9_08385 [Streptomyces sp. NPDC056367]|uniref:hypothetical protein n=1 Tax=unclassified Streptomyces TaxID=2593676 RepID=UPI0035D5BF83
MTSVLALVVSAWTFAQLQRDAHIEVALPAMLRLSQGEGYALVFVQPTLSTRQETDGVDIATTMTLSLTGPGPRPQFVWDETGKFEHVPNTGGLGYVPASDPGPLIVDRDSPQKPLARFVATGWKFEPGRYDGILEVKRGDAESIRQTFCLYLAKKDTDWLIAHRSYDQYRNDAPPGTATRHGDCYVAFDAYPALNKPSSMPRGDSLTP